MRIAFITYEFPPDTGKGGIGTYTVQMAELLVDAGNEVHVFAGSHHREEKERINGVTVYWVRCSGPESFRNKVVPVFQLVHKEEKIDIIECCEIHGNALQVKIKYPELPLVVRLHAPNHLVESLKKVYTPVISKVRFFMGALRRGRWDMGYWRTYDKAKDIDYQFVKYADHFTTPSDEMKNWVIENWKIPGFKIDVIPNPFKPSFSLLDIPVASGHPYKTIIFFGRLNVLKGLVNATKAIQKILKNYPNWHFKIIGDDGDGPIPGGLSMKKWMLLHLKPYLERVTFYNGVPYEDLPVLLCEGEIVLLPSLFESFSYTCVEAMAAGKAVVGSISGGMKNFITDNKNGLLIDPNNHNDIFKSIERLINDPKLCCSLSGKARDYIKYGVNNNDIVNNTLNAYKMCIEKRNG